MRLVQGALLIWRVRHYFKTVVASGANAMCAFFLSTAHLT